MATARRGARTTSGILGKEYRDPAAKGHPCGWRSMTGKPCHNPANYSVDGHFSCSRDHRSGPGLEFVVREGRGGYLFDVNGRRYLDYLLGSGPMLLGHAHPAVVEAVRRQMERGTSYMLLNEPSIELAEELVRAVPCAEQVRYTSSGSEATFFALRVARAFRKRDVKSRTQLAGRLT